MQIQTLHDNWTMQVVGQDVRIPAVVPGSVYHDLLKNGKMEDPFWRDNEMEALKWMEHDFVYSTCFVVAEEIKQSDKVLLRCDGLDTICDIFFNEKLIASANNQHRIWEFDVTEQVCTGDNQLKILFHSPTKYIKEMQAKKVVGGLKDAMAGFPHLRKAHCMFGWDWGPRLPDAGIWRDIQLVGIRKARLDSVYLSQQHIDGKVDLEVAVSVDAVISGDFSYEVVITEPHGTVERYTNSPQQIAIQNPQLWWPNGYGAQPLYTVGVILCAGGEVLDTWERRIGLRTMEMHMEPDEFGESFAHEVNGVQIFAMGADYIPEDNIFARITPQRTRALLEDCVAANFNTVRVWGGGYYPDDYFFDICDELGLVVWQDMMFACAVYELSDVFEENIKAEIVDNMKRLRHHASLGLWCGNNEIEMAICNGTHMLKSPKQKSDYVKIYEYIFPKIAKEHDPNNFYWPASPSSGGAFDEPNDPNRGDAHYWDVWHCNKPFSEFRKYFFRYASEFGFQSFPCEKTVESFTLPEDRNVFSYVMEKHQRNDSANGKIMNYMYQTYRYPTAFGTLLYASQLLQAEAIKYGVEHWRRNRGRCMGAVYWQLNDCWPVASWASVDYFGRWKALHYYAKRFFAPLMLSCNEEGTITQQANVNAECLDIEKSIQLNVANEMMQAQEVLVRWALRANNASVLQQGEEKLIVPALTSSWLDKIYFPDADIYKEYVSYELVQKGAVVSSGTVLFCAPKHFAFLNPQISVVIEGDMLVVSTSSYAKGVELFNENEDWVLEDNYFDLNNETRRIKIVRGEAVGIKVRSVFDIR